MCPGRRSLLPLLMGSGGRGLRLPIDVKRLRREVGARKKQGAPQDGNLNFHTVTRTERDSYTKVAGKQVSNCSDAIRGKKDSSDTLQQQEFSIAAQQFTGLECRSSAAVAGPRLATRNWSPKIYL